MGWIDTVSGDILTASTKVGALRIWNASNPSPKDMIKVSPHGIICMKAYNGHKGIYMLQCKNGEVLLFNVRKRKLLY